MYLTVKNEWIIFEGITEIQWKENVKYARK